MTGSVTFSTGIGGDGSTVTDDDNATTGLRDGGWRTRFVPCFTNQVSIANYVVTQANAASASATAAGSSATSAAAAYDSFDDRYLGAKTSDPTLDNDGNALLTGALYWNSTSSVMKVYSGSAWSAAYVPSSGYLALTGGTMSGAITFAAGQFGTNVNTFLTTPSSANLAAALTDETGTGVNVFNNTPTLITPILGTPQSGNLANCTFPTLNQNTTGTATTATNLASGSAGTIPYQSASGTTAMLAAGTSGQVLTSNGSAAPTWAPASGGGTATGASYTNPTAAGTAAAAFGSGASAAANYSTSLGNNSAGSQGSVTATGAGAMALGGSYASGTDSFAASIANNTSSYGAQSVGSIAIGYQASVSGSAYAINIGKSSVTNNADYAISLGFLNSASGGYAIGYQNEATYFYATAIGSRAKSTQLGKYSFAGGCFTSTGDSQYGKIVLRAATTTTTAVALTSNGNAASTDNQLIVASGQAMAIQGTLIAKVTASGAMAGWNITGIVSNNAGTMAVSGLALTAIGSDSITLGAQPTIAVDNTNKGVTITSGYKSATSIRWVANVQTSEVTYA